MAKIKDTSDANEKLREAQAEIANAKGKAKKARAQHAVTTRICASAQNEAGV